MPGIFEVLNDMSRLTPDAFANVINRYVPAGREPVSGAEVVERLPRLWSPYSAGVSFLGRVVPESWSGNIVESSPRVGVVSNFVSRLAYALSIDGDAYCAKQFGRILSRTVVTPYFVHDFMEAPGLDLSSDLSDENTLRLALSEATPGRIREVFVPIAHNFDLDLEVIADVLGVDVEELKPEGFSVGQPALIGSFEYPDDDTLFAVSGSSTPGSTTSEAADPVVEADDVETSVPEWATFNPFAPKFFRVSDHSVVRVDQVSHVSGSLVYLLGGSVVYADADRLSELLKVLGVE